MFQTFKVNIVDKGRVQGAANVYLGFSIDDCTLLQTVALKWFPIRLQSVSPQGFFIQPEIVALTKEWKIYRIYKYFGNLFTGKYKEAVRVDAPTS